MAIEQYRPSRFNLLPEVVKNLLIINGIFFLATVVIGDVLIDKLGLHYFESSKFRVYQIITYMFMHGNFTHILFNMFALWMFGTAVENLWGPKRFLIYYLFCGLGAAIVHYSIVFYQLNPAIQTLNDYVSAPAIDKFVNLDDDMLPNTYNIPIEQIKSEVSRIASANPNKGIELSINYVNRFKTDLLDTPLIVGASGAVFGILLAFGLLFPDTLLFIIPIPFPIKAKYAVILYGVAELFLGTAKFRGDNIAHFAHLGGLLFGLLLILYWRWKGLRRRHDFFNP